MAATRGWYPNSFDVLRDRVLLAARNGTSEGIPSSREIAEQLGVTPEEVGAVGDSLVASGLAEDFDGQSLASSYREVIWLSAEGKRQADVLVAARGTGSARAAACAAAALQWLDTAEGERASSIDDFLDDTRAWYFGEKFSADDVHRAAEVLQRHELVTGVRVWGGGLARPELTAAGRECLAEYDGDIQRWRRGDHGEGGGNAKNVTIVLNPQGSAIMTGSPGGQQTLSFESRPETALLGVVQAIEHMLPILGLDVENQETLQTRADQLRVVAEAGVTEPAEVRQWLEDVRRIAVSGAGAAVGQGLVAAVAGVLSAFGAA